MKTNNKSVIPIIGLLLFIGSLESRAQENKFNYKENAIKIFDYNNPLVGSSAILEYESGAMPSVISRIADTILKAHEGLKIDYGIGTVNRKGGLVNKSVFITQGPPLKRGVVFEVEVTFKPVDMDLRVIDKQREQWMALCNKHDAKNLIDQLYTENTIYYNHRPLVIGREALYPVYSYMNNPAYSLKLTPITVMPVNSKTVFEIGQCSGSYNGKYVLIWNKDNDGQWRVAMDSNI